MTEEPITNNEQIVEEQTVKQEPAKIKITDEDKDKFFKAFLSDIPYEDEMYLFNNKLKVSFRSLTLAENEQVFLQMKFDRENGISSNEDSYIIKIVQYRLGASLLKIDNEDFCPDITLANTPPSKDAGTYLLHRVKAMEKWNTFKLGAITDAYNRFEAKVRQLTEESFQENF